MTELEEIRIHNIKLQKQIDLLVKIATNITATHNDLVQATKSQTTVILENNQRLGHLENFMTALQEEVMPESDKIIN
jgi:tRNA(Phe) wybutosine-synthesizing methylase Tyw3